MSEIMRDDFELRAYVAQRPFPGEEFHYPRAGTFADRETSSARTSTSAAVWRSDHRQKIIKISAKGRTNGDGITTLSLQDA
jgi:hypothetical protein